MWNLQEVEPLTHLHDPGRGRWQLQTQKFEHISDVVGQSLNVRTIVLHEDDEVALISDDPPVRQGFRAASGVWGLLVSPASHVLIEPGKDDVGLIGTAR